MLIEIALIATSIYLIWGRQMAVKHKLVVVGAFFSRAPNIALTIMRLVFLNDPITLRDSDYWAARVVCTTEFAIGYTITSCMIPYLGPFMQPYEREPDQRLSTDRSYSKHSRGSSSTGTGITAPLSEYHFTSVKSRELTVDEEIEREILSNKEAKKWKDTGTELGGGLVVTKTVDWSVIYDETAAKEKDEDKTEGAKELKDTHKRSVRQVDEDDIQPVAPSERESLDMGVGGRREDQ
jgi:hypothetical protein